MKKIENVGNKGFLENNIYELTNEEVKKLENLEKEEKKFDELLEDIKCARPVGMENIQEVNTNPFMIMWFRLKEFLNEYDNYQASCIFNKMREMEIDLSYPYWKIENKQD